MCPNKNNCHQEGPCFWVCQLTSWTPKHRKEHPRQQTTFQHNIAFWNEHKNQITRSSEDAKNLKIAGMWPIQNNCQQEGPCFLCLSTYPNEMNNVKRSFERMHQFDVNGSLSCSWSTECMCSFVCACARAIMLHVRLYCTCPSHKHTHTERSTRPRAKNKRVHALTRTLICAPQAHDTNITQIHKPYT